MRRIVVIVGVLVGLVCPGSAQAIIGGEFDAANKYSNVGMLVTFEQGGWWPDLLRHSGGTDDYGHGGTLR
jgi:hypothetical protein